MKAYEKLKFYQNICEIRRRVSELTQRFSRTHLRLISQMRDAARSAKQNIREGYSKDTAGEFGHAIKISRGSLDELEGDIDDCSEDNLINSEEHQGFKSLLKQTKFLMDRYLDSLYRLDRAGRWKSRFKRNLS
jgi:four helix bundle protein